MAPTQEWTAVTAELVRALEPRTVLAIGEGDAGFIAELSALCAEYGGRIISIRDGTGGTQPPPGLEVRTPRVPESVADLEADVVVMHGVGGWWPTAWALAATARLVDEAPLVIVVGSDEQGLDEGQRLAVSGLLRDQPELELLREPNDRSVSVIVAPSRKAGLPAAAQRILGAWPAALTTEQDDVSDVAELQKHLRKATRSLVRERVQAQRADARVTELEASQRAALRLAAGTRAEPAGPGAEGSAADEPTMEMIRSIVEPKRCMAALGWTQEEAELGRPVPVDFRGALDRGGSHSLVVVVGDQDTDESEMALRRTLCSILDRTAVPVMVTVVMATDSAVLRRLLQTLELEVRVSADGPLHVRADAQRLTAGEELPWGWPYIVDTGQMPTLAYLLPGLPAEGSGGSHSVVQEARAIRALGAGARVCVPHRAVKRAEALYGNADELFVGYRAAKIEDAIGDASVAVATEHDSVALIATLSRRRPDVALAYYVQDYEPLFAALGSARSDRALLSYGALPQAQLFAKTHFIRNLVGARHEVSVAKVPPSLDRVRFHAAGRRAKRGSSLTVCAMVRPRTPRRRPKATLEALSQLAGDVRVVTFGCDRSELEALGAEMSPSLQHLGRLGLDEVAEQLRRSDIFIDGSAYQAFGRTGLEAMACGAVPLLPALGGVTEYAIDGENAVLLPDSDPSTIVEQVRSLAAKPGQLRRLRDAGIRRAQQFSVEQSAREQLEMFQSLRALDGLRGARTAGRSG